MTSLRILGWTAVVIGLPTLAACDSFTSSSPEDAAPIEVIEPLADPCPDRVQDMRGSASSFTCSCSTDTAEAGTVWGAGPYSDDSAVCRAAMHAGLVGDEPANVTVNFLPGREAYSQSIANGVETGAWGSWGGSFAFEGAALGEPEEDSYADACPDNAQALRGTDEAVTCRCTADALTDGTVWGTNIYSDDSAICKAAVHAGVITEAGGDVRFVPIDGQETYAGSEANGVETRDFGAWEGSFEFIELEDNADADDTAEDADGDK